MMIMNCHLARSFFTVSILIKFAICSYMYTSYGTRTCTVYFLLSVPAMHYPPSHVFRPVYMGYICPKELLTGTHFYTF